MTYSVSDVNAWYQLVQFRDGPIATITSYVSLLNNGFMTEQQVQEAIIADPYTTANVNPILRLYQAAFNRSADIAGLKFWSNIEALSPDELKISNLQTIANGFANSKEFFSIYGVNGSDPINASVLTGFYQNILGRAPDHAGYSYWLNSGLNIGQVLHQFSQSSEFIKSSATAIVNYEMSLFHTSTVPDNNITQDNTVLPVAKSIFLTDSDGSSGYSVNDKIVISFNKDVGDKLSISDLVLDKGHSFGIGATITPLTPFVGHSNSFVISLGVSPTVAAFDKITIDKTKLQDVDGKFASTDQTFTLPKIDLTAPEITSAIALDCDRNATYSSGDKLTITFSEPIASTLAIVDLLPTNGSHHFGNGATVMPLDTVNGKATVFEITLGTAPTVVINESIGINKDKLADAVGNTPNANLIFLAPKIDVTAPTALSIVNLDADSSSSYTSGDKLTITFSEPVANTLALADLLLNNGHHFGSGATIAALNSSNGKATTFQITLGSFPTVAASDLIFSDKTKLADAAGNEPANNLAFTVPQIDFTSPAAQAIHNADLDFSSTYTAGDRIILEFSEYVDSTLSMGDLGLNNGHAFGLGATIAPLSPMNGKADLFEITLGTSPTILPSDVINVDRTKLADGAGNVPPVNLTFIVPQIDTTAPVASVTAATIAAGGNALVQSTELGTAYLVNSSISVTNLASITNSADNQFNSVSITTPNTNTNLATTGLADGVYIAYTVDASGNLSTASSNSVTFDGTAPSLSSSSPLDNATSILGSADIVLNFSETVSAGNGNIIIKKSSDNSIVTTIDIHDSLQVNFSGSSLTINPTSNLSNSTEYYVLIDSGAITDVAGNLYAGITSPTALSFTTVTAPLITTNPAAASLTTISLTTNEACTAQLYAGSTPIGSPVSLSANISGLITVAPALSPTLASIVVTSTASGLSTTSPVTVLLGTNSFDTLTGDSNANLIFGFAGFNQVYGVGGIDTFVIPNSSYMDSTYIQDLALNNESDVVINYGSTTATLQGNWIATSETKNFTNYFSIYADNAESVDLSQASGTYGYRVVNFGTGSVIGSLNDDSIEQGAYSAVFTGGAGADSFNAYSGATAITITDLGNGADIILQGMGVSATIAATVVSDWVSNGTIYNGTGLASLTSASAGVDINVSAGYSSHGWSITGSTGTEILIGSAYDDFITGGAGVDDMTGGSGIDKFIFATTDIDTAAGAVTDIIRDFAAGTDTIGGSFGAAAGILTEAGASAASLTALLAAADIALDGTIKYYVGQITGGDVYIVTDNDGTGYTDVIQLVGQTLASFDGTVSIVV